MEILAALYSSGLAAYLVYWDREGAANTGFSLNMAGTSSTAALPDGSTN